MFLLDFPTAGERETGRKEDAWSGNEYISEHSWQRRLACVQ